MGIPRPGERPGVASPGAGCVTGETASRVARSRSLARSVRRWRSSAARRAEVAGVLLELNRPSSHRRRSRRALTGDVAPTPRATELVARETAAPARPCYDAIWTDLASPCGTLARAEPAEARQF